MKWNNFYYSGKEYDLSHLHPFQWQLEGYKFSVLFSMHCFTKKPLLDEPHDETLYYHGPKEKDRVFCFDRYELSQQLPNIIRRLNERPCWHTHHGSFFTIELQSSKGETKDYEVYFDVFKSGSGWMTLQIKSAYIRDTIHKTARPRKRRIRFSVIAKNRAVGKKLRPPR